MRKIIVLASVFLSVPLAGCAHNVNPDTYGVGTVGNVNRAVRGEVISVRAVEIDGTTGSGALAGGAAGGVAGSAVGGSARANVVGAIGGAVAGAIAGAAIEQSATKQKGTEYVVQTENGALLTVVQADDLPLSVGERVIVLYGARSRLIPDKAAR